MDAKSNLSAKERGVWSD